MRYLVIQDDTNVESILSRLIHSADGAAAITVGRTFSEATRHLTTSSFDLIVFDVYLPLSNSSEPERNFGSELLETFMSSRNNGAETVLVTKDSFAESDVIPIFNQFDVVVISYVESRGDWQSALLQKIRKTVARQRFDFLIFNALPKESRAFFLTEAKPSEIRSYAGLNCREMRIGDSIGLNIEPVRPGPVDIAIVATKAIEYFRPRIVAMGGICAGIRGETSLMDLLIADPCWNYQSGKTKAGEFLPEPYQVSLLPELRADLTRFYVNGGEALIDQLIAGVEVPGAIRPQIVVGAAASGAGVVSDNETVAMIKDQHRKIAGFDMEIAAFYQAAVHARCKPTFFATKVVVDLGDENKGDALHDCGSVVAARFIVRYLSGWLQTMA
jgi:nucleoside phosphorylase